MIKFITIPVLLRNGEPDFTDITKATKKIGRGLKKGDIIIVESSLPPGTTKNILKPILEEESRMEAGKDFHLAYSPQRVVVENVVHDIEEAYPKIVGGINKDSATVVKSIYEKIVKKGVIIVSDTTTAEFTKLSEGIYRDVNIALANELARLARRIGIDFREVIEAANSQPYSHIHNPGPGVGGTCIPIYPRFMQWIAKKHNINLRLTILAREINEEQPENIVEMVEEYIEKIGIEKPEIAVLGLSYKGGVPDTRNSPSIEIINILKEQGYKIKAYDPYIEEDIPEACRELEDTIKGADVIIITTDHREFRELTIDQIKNISDKEEIIIIDTRNILSLPNNGKMGNIHYIGSGRPYKIY
jgi:nucleotide sugar dehydrogenase